MTENIHTAIVKIMDEVGYVKKQRGNNLNYTYAGEAALIQAIRPEMVENGVYMHVSAIHNITRDTYETSRGTSMNTTVIHGTVTFTHAASETSVNVDAVGEGSDVGDKSASKAMTGVFKYAIRQTYCLETGDDPDRDPSGEQERKRKQAPAKKNGSKPAEPPAKPKHAMDYETAAKVTNSDGELYISLDADKLSKMTIGIDTALKNPKTTPERREELEFKMDAIKVILAKRQEA